MPNHTPYDTSGRNPIHILLADGRQVVYPEVEVHDLLTRRALSRRDLFWKEGMDDWLPLSHIPPLTGLAIAPPRRVVAPMASAEMPEPTPQAEPRRPDLRVDWSGVVPELPAQNFRAPKVEPGGPPRQYYLQNDPVPLTLSMQGLILISTGAITFFILECLSKMEGWATLFQSNTTVVYVFFAALVGTHLVVDVLFLCWLFRANRNCRGFVSNVRYTSDTAVASFFVPFINFVRPYQVVQEIWKVSERPWSWNGARDSFFVGFWFLLRTSLFVLAVVQFHTIYADGDEFAFNFDGFMNYAATLQANILLIELTTFILVSVVTARQLRYAADS